MKKVQAVLDKLHEDKLKALHRALFNYFKCSEIKNTLQLKINL